jgi:predicted SnoaL-like aldol condensation-catalyzing enzyme
MTPKEAAVDFLQMVVARKIDEAYTKHIDMNGKHHNAYFAAGFPILREAMKEAHRENPDTELRVKHVLGDGDMVMVHSHVIMKPGELGVAVVHMFRFENGKIVEMWDCGQAIAESIINTDGVF